VATDTLVDADDLTTEQLIELCWEGGNLAYKLQKHQLELIYKPYRAWEQGLRDGTKRKGAARVWMLDAGRQVGKTYTVDLIKIEDCIRQPGTKHLIASAEEISLKEFVIPNIDAIIADAPAHLRPRFIKSHKGLRSGYLFPNGSVLKLVGIDKNPDGLRGPKLHGAVISEAAFVRKLKKTIGSVLYPQFQRTPYSTLILESSAPDDPAHDFDVIFKPDCESRNAYVFLTIDDNTALTDEQRTEFVEAARIIDPDDAEREYYGKRIRNRTKVIIPEFDPPTKDRPVTRHVQEFERPRFAIAAAAMDPGMRDMFAVVWGYWDAVRAQLMIELDWAERNASTGAVADAIRSNESSLYGDASELLGEEQWILSKAARTPEFVMRPDGLVVPKPKKFDDKDFILRRKTNFGLKPPAGMTWWDGKEFRGNPLYRVSDVDKRLIGDLNLEYGIGVINTAKDDKEAALFALRSAFRADKIVIHPRCVKLIKHLTAARWNEQRTDFERTEEMGHYDLLDAMVYLWRMTQAIRGENPCPPEFYDRNDGRVVYVTPPQAVSHDVQRLRKAFGGQRTAWR
jgi:hypothetical protein